MKIQTTYIRFSNTPDIEQYLAKRMGVLAKFLRRYESAGELALMVEVSRPSAHHRHGEVFEVKATIDVPRHGLLRAEAVGEDVRNVIDQVKQKLKKEILTKTGQDKDHRIRKRVARFLRAPFWKE